MSILVLSIITWTLKVGRNDIALSYAGRKDQYASRLQQPVRNSRRQGTLCPPPPKKKKNTMIGGDAVA